MLALITASLIIALVVFIIIIREFIITGKELKYIKKGLEKNDVKNLYEIRKLIRMIKQSNDIIRNSESIEEKIHWCEVVIDKYNKLIDRTPDILHEDITEKIKKFKHIYEILHKKHNKINIKKNIKDDKDDNIGVA